MSTSMSNPNYDAMKGPIVGIGNGTSVQNGYLEFFGEPLREPSLSDSDGHFHTHEDLPEAYRGKNVLLANVVEGLVSQMPTFLNSYALPLKFSQQMEWKWNEYNFDQGFIEQVPHEGVPRILRHTSTSRSASTVRHAVAVYFEYDFFMTEEGRQMYAMELTQIKCNIKNTMSYDAIVTIQNAHNDDDMFMEQYGLVSLTPEGRLNREYEQYGMIQKNYKGLEIMDGKLKELAGLVPFTPNMYIAPLGLRRYVNIVPEKRTLYMYAGPRGVNRLIQGPEALGDIQGTATYEIPNFRTFNGENNNLHIMENQTQHGEYFLNLASEFSPSALQSTPYKSSMRNMWLYDQKKDRIIEVTFKKIVENAILPTNGAQLMALGDADDALWKTIVDGDYENTDVVGAAILVAIKDRLKARVQDDLHIPMSFILERPWQEDIMADVILMKGGQDTGNTFWGFSNFKLAENATIKTIFGNYTYYSKCVIRKPKNILVAKNVFYRGYKRGTGTEMFTENELKELGSKNFKFHDMEGATNKSLIVLCIPSSSTEQDFDKFIDITGSFEDEENGNEHYPGGFKYCRQFDWDGMLRPKRGLAFQKKMEDTNSICARGFSQTWANNNPKGKLILCQGAHGDVMYDGVGKYRAGLDYEPDFKRAITK